MLTSNPLVVEWHDLTDPKVLIGIDVVAHAASSQDLDFDSEGNALSFMGIPLTRSLRCSSCGTAIGWSTDTYSCPGCGGRELGKFEANRDLGRQRMSRKQWDERYQETRRQLALSPGRRDDVEGLSKDDADWDDFSESDSQSDEEGGTRVTARGTIQAASRDRQLQRMTPFPSVNGSCMDVVPLQHLDKVHICLHIVERSGKMCTQHVRSFVVPGHADKTSYGDDRRAATATNRTAIAIVHGGSPIGAGRSCHRQIQLPSRFGNCKLRADRYSAVRIRLPKRGSHRQAPIRG